MYMIYCYREKILAYKTVWPVCKTHTLYTHIHTHIYTVSTVLTVCVPKF